MHYGHHSFGNLASFLFFIVLCMEAQSCQCEENKVLSVIKMRKFLIILRCQVIIFQKVSRNDLRNGLL